MPQGQSTFCRQQVVAVCLAATIGTCLDSSANAAVVVDDAKLSSLSSPTRHQELSLSKTIPSGEGLFLVAITPKSSFEFDFSPLSIAEWYGIFPVAAGTNIDASFASSTPSMIWTPTPTKAITTTVLFDEDQSRLFAYWDDRKPFLVNSPSVDDNYGWVELTRVGTALQITGGATAIGGGIIAGTLTQLPEPAITLPFVATGLLARRRNRAI